MDGINLSYNNNKNDDPAKIFIDLNNSRIFTNKNKLLNNSTLDFNPILLELIFMPKISIKTIILCSNSIYQTINNNKIDILTKLYILYIKSKFT